MDVTAYITLSDTHVGRKTQSYDSSVFFDMMSDYRRQVRRNHSFAKRKKIYPEKTVLILGGDMVDGEGVYKKQAYELEMNIDDQIDVFLDGLKMLDFDEIIAVVGNHGIANYGTTGNYDLILYKIIREKGYKIRYTGLYHGVFDGFLVSHPYTVRMYQNIPYYGITQYVMRFYMKYSMNGNELFDSVLLGHFHTPFKIYVNGIPTYGNGSFLLDDNLSLEKGYFNKPYYWFIVRSDNRIVFDREIKIFEKW